MSAIINFLDYYVHRCCLPLLCFKTLCGGGWPLYHL